MSLGASPPTQIRGPLISDSGPSFQEVGPCSSLTAVSGSLGQFCGLRSELQVPYETFPIVLSEVFFSGHGP